MEYKFKGQCNVLIDVMKQRNISKYALCRMINMPIATLYSFLNGRSRINEAKCAIIADAMQVDIQNLFPWLNVIMPELADIAVNPQYDPRGQKDEVIMKAEEIAVEQAVPSRKITAVDMVPGSATIVPEDGVMVKSRRVRVDGEEYEGHVLQTGEQCMVYTGIKARGIDTCKSMIKTEKKLLIEHEVHLHPFFHVVNSELVCVIFNLGKPFQIYRGMVIGEIIIA